MSNILNRPLPKFLSEFREFAIRGNVVDLAVGVVIGGAFGKIVTSFVNDIITPPLGLLLGGVDFDHYKIILRNAETVNGVNHAAIALNIGNFLQSIFDFAIIAFAVYLMVRIINTLKRQAAAAEVTPAAPALDRKEELLTEIRDLLQKTSIR